MANSRFIELIDTDGYLYGTPAVRFTVLIQLDSWQDKHTWKLLSYSGAYAAGDYCQSGTWTFERIYLSGSRKSLLKVYLNWPSGKRFCQLGSFESDNFLYFPVGMEAGGDGSGVLMLKGEEGRIQPNVAWHVVAIPVDPRYVWFGCGSKIGAIVGVGGEEEGKVLLYNGADRTATAEIKYRLKRSGVGLGGSVGGVFCIVTGCSTAGEMVGAPCSCWDFSLSVLASFDGLLELCRSKGYLQLFAGLGEVLYAGGKLGEKQWEGLSNLVKIMLGASSMNCYSKGLSTFDIPFGGTGGEISFFWAEGSIIEAKRG
ncbi:MAG: hypothetical protein J0L64_22150 [Acidobacteria bacterium]|nr:hypothetical protein [Acidobacteriota bacterium]